MRELNRLTNAIKHTMVSIAYTNFIRISRETGVDNVDNEVDIAFTAIEYSFPDFECITDTTTRNCAKIAINEVIESTISWIKLDSKIEALSFIQQNISIDEVIDDIIEMNGDEDQE